ncbi:MAG: TolC family protein [Desulfobacterales bacterium]
MNPKPRSALSTISAVLCLCLFMAPAANGGLYEAPGTLIRLLTRTDENNDSLRQLESEVDALLEEVPAARTLDDPMLTLGINALPTDTFSFSQEPMTQKQIFIAQRIPWFGKLDLRSRKVALAAAKKKEMLRARRLELHRAVSEAYFELAFIDRSIDVNAELQQMVGQILRVAEAVYASGRGLQQDVLQAQVEQGKLIDEKATLVSRKQVLEDQLNELVNEGAFFSVETEGIPPIPDEVPTVDSLSERVLSQNPALAAMAIDIETAGVDIELARKDYWPDLSIAVGYGQREEDMAGRDLPDFVSGSVSFNIPIWFRNKQDKKFQAALKRKTAAEKAYEHLEQRLPHQVDALISEIRSLRDNYRLFDEALLLQTEQWSQASLAAYEVGKVDFDTMINAHVRRLRFGLQADRYRASVFKSLSRLQELAAVSILEEAASDSAGLAGAAAVDSLDRGPENQEEMRK